MIMNTKIGQKLLELTRITLSNSLQFIVFFDASNFDSTLWLFQRRLVIGFLLSQISLYHLPQRHNLNI
jgi:hypothetical protein